MEARRLHFSVAQSGGYSHCYPKFVVSTTLKEPEWNNSNLINGNLAEEVLKPKEQPGRDILIFGSGDLVRALTKDGLIDEYRLLVYPVVRGIGKHLFGGESVMKSLKLTGTQMFSSGVVALTYEPASKAGDG